MIKRVNDMTQQSNKSSKIYFIGERVGILADKQIEWYDMKTILWIALSGKSPEN